MIDPIAPFGDPPTDPLVSDVSSLFGAHPVLIEPGPKPEDRVRPVECIWKAGRPPKIIP